MQVKLGLPENKRELIIWGKIEISEDDALSKHNLLPLQARRDIAALGIIHKVTIGIADPEIAEMFPPGAVRPLQLPDQTTGEPTQQVNIRHMRRPAI